MSAFFVGQRVRLVHPQDARFKGDQGRISRIAKIRVGDMTPIGRRTANAGDCLVDWDDGSELIVSDMWRLEPILPEGHRPAELTVEELLPFVRETVHA